MSELNNNEDWLLDDISEPECGTPQRRPWNVLIIDDEKDVHSATRLAKIGRAHV